MLIFRKRHVIILGLFSIVCFWFADAVFDAFVLGEGNFLSEALLPEPHEVWERSVLSIFLVIFTGFVWGIVSQRDRFEAELTAALADAAAERAKSAAIVAAIGDGISIQDLDFRVLYQNDMHRTMVGGDCAGQICYKAYDESAPDVPCHDCPVVQSFQDGEVHRLVKHYSAARGDMTLEITASALRDETGRIVAGIEVVRDITAHIRAEEAVKQQARFLQTLLDTIPYPVFFTDASLVFGGCNQAFEECNGNGRDGLIGRPVLDVLPPDLAAPYARSDRQILQQPSVQTFEGALSCANGKKLDAIFKKAPYFDTDGAVAGIVCVVVDITERKATERAISELNRELGVKAQDLELANRELESFSYSVTHDLRKPLTIIYTAAQALRDECSLPLDDTAKYFVDTMIDGSRRMEELIEALQVLTHVTRSGMTVAVVDLSVLAGSIIDELKMIEPERTVIWKAEPGLSTIGDPRLLRVLLENLLGNAWKYTAKCPDARITFGLARTEHDKAYFVRDNGAGFDMARSGDLFKPFVRLHQQRDFPGTGVGLATVQRIVQRHGGRVWAEGVIGEGATFFFTLPESHPLID